MVTGSETRIPNVNTLADLIDRLIVEVNKLSWFENKKREEHAKSNPDSELIAKWDNLSRDCCELRSILKSEINRCMQEIVETQAYHPIKEARTFRPPEPAYIIDMMCSDTAKSLHCGALAKELGVLHTGGIG
jgi:hypothetical protein